MRNPASSGKTELPSLPSPAARPLYTQKPHLAAMASSLAFKSTLLAGESGRPRPFRGSPSVPERAMVVISIGLRAGGPATASARPLGRPSNPACLIAAPCRQGPPYQPGGARRGGCRGACPRQEAGRRPQARHHCECRRRRAMRSQGRRRRVDRSCSLEICIGCSQQAQPFGSNLQSCTQLCNSALGWHGRPRRLCLNGRLNADHLPAACCSPAGAHPAARVLLVRAFKQPYRIGLGLFMASPRQQPQTAAAIFVVLESMDLLGTIGTSDHWSGSAFDSCCCCAVMLQVPGDRQGGVRGPERHPLPRGGALREGERGSGWRASGQAPAAADQSRSCKSRMLRTCCGGKEARCADLCVAACCTTGPGLPHLPAGELRGRVHQQLRP